MRILVVEPLAAEGIEILRAHHEVDEQLGLPREEIVAILPDYDALVVRSQVKADAEMIAAGTRLVVIGRAGVGVDNVDLDAATRAGITVVNAPTGNTIAAAEHTLALLFGLARHTAAADASMQARRVEALAVHRHASCAARRWASSGWARSARRSRCGPGRMEMTVLGLRPVRDARAGGRPSGSTSSRSTRSSPART